MTTSFFIGSLMQLIITKPLTYFNRTKTRKDNKEVLKKSHI